MRKKRTLSDLNFDFSEGTYALGRLDENTEGMLLLTNNKKISQALMHPKNKHKRKYWVQVHGNVNAEEIQKLENGVDIILEGAIYTTMPCVAKIIKQPENLPPRGHPVGTHFATTWIELILEEGKFHQIRKMSAAIGHQTMRLIRVSIENLVLTEFIPSQVIELTESEFLKKLKIVLP